MKRILYIIVAVLLVGCAQPKRDTTVVKIRDWQAREAPLQEHLPEILDADEFGYLETKTLLKEILSLDNVPKMTYVADDGDYWQTSEEFEQNNYTGDCEDMAIFVYRKIREARVFADNDVAMRFVGRKEIGFHVVVVVYTSGQPLFVDNGSLRDLRNLYEEIVAEFNLFAIW